jgi:hypothetical protein
MSECPESENHKRAFRLEMPVSREIWRFGVWIGPGRHRRYETLFDRVSVTRVDRGFVYLVG